MAVSQSIKTSQPSLADRSYRKRRSWNDYFKHDSPPPLNKRKRQILEDFDNLNANESRNIFDRGWTLNPDLKLLGKPRLRQVRVKTGTCKEVSHIVARNTECAAELNLFNVETGRFTLFWESSPIGLTETQASPWMYQSGLETATLPVMGKLAIYPAGGYVLELAKQIDNARLVLDFLDEFQWIDVRTRAVFIEFTVYSINTNLFNVVSLLAEKSATGYIVPSYQIDTCKFIFLGSDLEYVTMMMSVLLAFLLFFFLLRESLRIHRTSFKLYLKRAFAILDLVLVVLGVLCLVFLVFRNIYVTELLSTLEKANNNDFISFVYAATWHTWSVYIEAFLICLASFKLIRLLSFKVVFFQFRTTLGYCYKHFFSLVLQQAVLIIAFAFFFNLTLLNFSERFCLFGMSFCTMVARAVALDDDFDYSIFGLSGFLSLMFFGLFVFLVSILFMNMFIAVICLYFHKIRNVPLNDRYNLGDYIKYFLTMRRQKDLFHIKNILPENTTETNDTKIMRLRGGGNKMAKGNKIKKMKCKKQKKKKTSKKVKKKKTKAKKEEEENKGEDENREIMMKDFVTKKPYDLTEYRDLDDLRNMTMKNLTASYLTDNDNLRKIFRNNALKGLFISFITDPRQMNHSGDYFFVVNKSETQVYDKSMFLKMRKVVEDFGKEKCWFVDEKVDEEIERWEKKLAELDKKLCLLLKKK